MLTRLHIAPLALLGFLALASQAGAQTAHAGSGTLVGGERLRVSGCGRMAGPVSLDVALDSDGTWTAGAYSGTWTPVTRRLARLTLDAASLAALESELEADASALCEETVTISALRAGAHVKVSKRMEFARLRFAATGAGSTASGDEGRGLYRLRARGPWTPEVP